MFKKEIFELPVTSDDFSRDFAKNLKVEIKLTQSDVKSKTFRDFLGSLPDDVIDALKNTKVYIFKHTSYEENDDHSFTEKNSVKDYNMQFIYPEMDIETRKMISNLFFSPLDFRWKKDPKLKGYPSTTVILYADRLYPKFIGSMLCGNTSGFLTGTVEFRVTKK